MINRYCSIRKNLANVLTKNDALQKGNSFLMEIKNDDQKIKNYINQCMDNNLNFRKEGITWDIIARKSGSSLKKPPQSNVAETIIETKNESSHIKSKRKNIT